jgi:xanthine dehydrogenase accessory factor
VSFSLIDMRRAVAKGLVARVVVAETKGSAPREVGAAMLVASNEVTGTIGGGALEFEAIRTAKAALRDGTDRLDRRPLGPGLGQCCGGAVTVLTEIWDVARLNTITGDVVARPLPGISSQAPLSVRRLMSAARSSGDAPTPRIVNDWMVEPVSKPHREIWVWGAGHVGRAIVAVLAPIPDVTIRWADTGEERFPTVVPENVETLIADNPADLVSIAPAHAEHLVLTYSHAFDLEICHRVLGQPFKALGLIGSATKRARFRSRLCSLGHASGQIDRMRCPIGDPKLGKHPQQIALGVAAELLTLDQMGEDMIGERA